MATTPHPDPVEVGPYAYRWNVEEYERLRESGLLDHVRTELIEGCIEVVWLRDRADKEMGQGNAHITAIRLVVKALRLSYGEGFDVNAQLPLPLTEFSIPEPDALVLRGRAEDYDGRDPDPRADVALVVEVSDTSLTKDQVTKARLYAAHGVREYWIVNLQDRTLEVRRRPRPELGAYAETIVFQEGESVAVGSGEVAVSDLLPKSL